MIKTTCETKSSVPFHTSGVHSCQIFLPCQLTQRTVTLVDNAGKQERVRFPRPSSRHALGYLLGETSLGSFYFPINYLPVSYREASWDIKRGQISAADKMCAIA
ncbi:hypothetical protein ElyMa_006956000 [Elysia marginata]|uniref:Uncharacterized protein n=1 Tax=Elysia marginata TaxID=1093978 RepID=A0AAV4JJV7_9GAST|nr:hypothetical protein ElyMa_006956000 [Elysia marginata]